MCPFGPPAGQPDACPRGVYKPDENSAASGCTFCHFVAPSPAAAAATSEDLVIGNVELRMDQEPGWRRWRQFFESRAERPLPALDMCTDYTSLPKSLANSLAIFQLGESGGGTIVAQARASLLPGVDGDYAEAIAYFVEEEHRHANILAMCVRMLGGELKRSNWTARLFVAGRRLMGLRLKILVLLAAEVVGICYYMALASALPASPMRSWLAGIVDDERAHLEFHCRFLNSQVTNSSRRRLFIAAWRSVMVAAAVVVMIDHRRTIRDLGFSYRQIWKRWMAISELAEKLVSGSPGPVAPGYVPAPAVTAKGQAGSA